MSHLLLFWTEAEDTHFLALPEGKRRILLFFLWIYVRACFSSSVAFIT